MSNQSASMAVVVVVLSLAGCGMHWPWKHHAPPAPKPVQELTVEGGGTILQFWDRNTLQIDLTAVSGEGMATLRAPHGWPIRLEFKVMPGSFGELEVRGAQRTVFEVSSQDKPVILKLPSGAYVRDTPQIAIRWSAAGGSAH